MQNTSTAQRAQNSNSNAQTVTIPVELLTQTADTLFAYERLAGYMATITTTIKQLAAGRSQYVLIESQAELLCRLLEDIELRCDTEDKSYSLYELIEEQMKTASAAV
ncbi:hypothetical protein V6667_00550 [Neisseria leonii]|uniref:Uncharacterized protein n=1 Tax=Neisseria leonii TaxID=2995413 RepID=A0A9X4E317_9NEIS|nr:hypothetical protein [Neisseria sp. 51.81]MDD9328533.1 hypothetical protein [Neisseria sp. 51.81]